MTDDAEFRDRIVQATAEFMLERFFKVNARSESFYVTCCLALAARAAALSVSNVEDPAAELEALRDQFVEQLHAHVLAVAVAADAGALSPPAVRPGRIVH